MGSSANRLRNNWQKLGGKQAGSAEKIFYDTFRGVFENSEYKIRKRPKDFSNIYVEVKLRKCELEEIYTPPEPITKHGIFPDYAIDNIVSQKTIYVEIKRQDGWVEGKSRSAGRGNAHERSCKYFTPGLLNLLRKQGNIDNNTLPFWTVFLGDITRDPCRVREITLWYHKHTANYFFWRNTQETEAIIEHFIKKIKPLLD